MGAVFSEPESILTPPGTPEGEQEKKLNRNSLKSSINSIKASIAEVEEALELQKKNNGKMRIILHKVIQRLQQKI